MTTRKPDISSLSVVLIGDFNPKIFQPAWFSAEGLIGKSEAESANILTIHPEICIFQLEWLQLEVTRYRFIVETSQEPYFEVLRDLVFGTFELLSHTPLYQLGVNLNAHYKTKNEDEWHAFGHLLTPKDIWNEVLDHPGMSSITIEGDPNRDGFKGKTNVKVEPSKKVHPGVYFNINNHYEVEDRSKSIGANEIVKTLKQMWQKSIDKSFDITNKLIQKI
jgi:hypothetical protein